MKTWDLAIAGNAVLAGLVSITANCAVVEPVGAFIGAFVYIASKKMLIKLKIDDPLDAAPVHGFCGGVSLPRVSLQQMQVQQWLVMLEVLVVILQLQVENSLEYRLLGC